MRIIWLNDPTWAGHAHRFQPGRQGPRVEGRQPPHSRPRPVLAPTNYGGRRNGNFSSSPVFRATAYAGTMSQRDYDYVLVHIHTAIPSTLRSEPPALLRPHSYTRADPPRYGRRSTHSGLYGAYDAPSSTPTSDPRPSQRPHHLEPPFAFVPVPTLGSSMRLRREPTRPQFGPGRPRICPWTWSGRHPSLLVPQDAD